MSDDMTDKYRIFRRASGVWYLEDRENHHQVSLRTHVEAEAKRLLQAKNEALRQPAINIQIARAYLTASDPKLVTRTWQEVMETLTASKDGTNQDRWLRAIKDRSFDHIRHIPLMETRAEHFLKVLMVGKVSSNVFLRRIHNFALAMDWLMRSVIPKASWPKVSFKTKRAITLAEHRRIIERENNPERRAFYQMCWHLGGSQMDVANLTADNVDWQNQTISYQRQKLKKQANIKPPIIRFGCEVAALLQSLPQSGPLFPNLRAVRSSDRATEFKQRCNGLGIVGVTLHSYRYAWAERARKVGYPMRAAQEALGHNSKAVHRSYAKNAEVRIDSLDKWENQAESEQARARLESETIQIPGRFGLITDDAHKN
jgi:integrase